MKINGTPPGRPNGATASNGKPEAARTPAAAPAGASAPGGSQVSISDLATRLGSIESDLAQPFDASRVEALKQAIRDGQFKVNPEAVADKLIDHLKQVLAGRTA